MLTNKLKNTGGVPMSRIDERGGEGGQRILSMRAEEPGAAESEVTTRIHDIAQAIRNKDLDALMAMYAEDVVVFDVFPPLDTRGLDNYRRNYERWFSWTRGPIYYQMRDLQVICSGRLASAHFLSNVSIVRPGGTRLDYWVRVSSQLQNRGGQWLVTHEHISMPARL